MSNSIIHAGGNKKKIFDPRDSSTGSGGFELVDASIALRGEQWWMYLAGQAHGSGSTDLYSASLPPGEPLSSAGWKLSRGTGEPPSPVAGRKISHAWDGKGGRHCPCYVKGWDPGRREWRERIYYAGGAENLWGPYAIGFLEWDGQIWADRAKPVFTATEDWEHGSVFEPNLIYHDGKWKMWYVAGSNHEDYLAQGYAESDDGISWSQHRMFASPEMRMFDFCVCIHRGEFHAIFARVWVRDETAPPQTGLWWCGAPKPSSQLSDWSPPIQIMTAADCGWHSGPWKPSFQFLRATGDGALVFFNGLYRTSDPGPFPFAFTLGCVEANLPSIVPIPDR
jgi:hypothetical protein